MNVIKDLEEKLFFLEEEIKKTENYLGQLYTFRHKKSYL